MGLFLFRFMRAAAMALAIPVFAWGPSGHHAVALIAEARLTPKARAEARRLLFDGRYSLFAISVCADVVRDTQRPSADREMCEKLAGPVPPENGTWHYIDITLGAEDQPLMRFCPAGNCAVARIRRFAAILRDSKDDAQRRAALLFLVHFVGDLHQPLHAIERGCDKGGTLERVNVIVGGKQLRDESLHWTWDSHLLHKYMAGEHLANDGALAARLLGEIDPAEARKWAEATVEDVAWESHALAKQFVYPGIPFQDFCAVKDSQHAPTVATDLTPRYETRAAEVIHRQLMKAGVRLGAMLNAALDAP